MISFLVLIYSYHHALVIVYELSEDEDIDVIEKSNLNDTGFAKTKLRLLSPEYPTGGQDGDNLQKSTELRGTQFRKKNLKILTKNILFSSTTIYNHFILLFRRFTAQK